MKFGTLEIKNIASISEATISFDNSPLSSEPLFLICGATGSGKSTILDAICLALYGTAPRLEGYGNESYKDQKLNLTGDSDNVRLSHPCQLVRRDTGEAFARLSFVGNDNKHYTAMWHASRGAKKRLDVKLKAENTLYCRESDTTINKRVSEEIARPEIVGLKFEEFCRTTLLAQGAFTRFLNCKSNEKSDILEKLTGTEIYSRISREIYLTYTGKNREYELKKTAIDAQKLLSYEERKEKQLLIKKEENLIAKLKQESHETEKKLTWLKTHQQYETAKKDEEKRLAEANEKACTPTAEANRRLLAEWNISEELRNNNNQLKSLLPERVNNQQQQKLLHKEYQQLATGQVAMQQMLQTLVEQQTVLQQRLTNAAKDIPMYENAGFLTAQMQEFLRKTAEKGKIGKELLQHKQQLPQTTETIDKLTAERKHIEVQLMEKENERQRIAEEQKLQPSTATLNSRKEKIDRLATITKDIKLTTERYNNEEAKQEDIKQKMQTASKNLILVEKEKSEAETSRQQQEELYNTMHLRIDNHAKALRAKLKSGDECPVCGEKIRHLFHDKEVLELLQPIEQQRNNAIKLHEEKVTEYNNLIAQTQSYKTLGEDVIQQLTTIAKEKKALELQFESLCSELLIDVQNEDISTFIENECNAITIQQQKNDTLAKNILDISEQIVKLRQPLTILLDNIAKSMALREQIRSAITQEEQQLANIEKIIEQISNEINATITIDEWQKDIQKTIVELQNRSAAYSNAKERNTLIQQEIKKHTEQIARINYYRTKVENSFTHWKIDSNVTPSEQQAEDLDHQWNKLANKCELLYNNIQRTEKSIGECEAAIETFYISHPEIDRTSRVLTCLYEEIQQIEAIEKQMQQDIEKSKVLVTEWQKRCEELLQNKPAIHEEDTIDSLMNKKADIDEQRSLAEQRAGAISGELKQDDDKATLLIKEREDAARLYNEASKWKRLSDIFGSAEGGKFKSIAQSYILEQLLENANYYLRRFTTQYELTTQPGSLVILITDKTENNITRPVNTLSGGESFMVSLALAFGLSSLNHNKFTPDTLFIDEGFGTLSGDYLNTVIETLEVLHSIGNRRVGIISHVNELYERIPTRIEVKKQRGASRVEVVG